MIKIYNNSVKSSLHDDSGTKTEAIFLTESSKCEKGERMLTTDKIKLKIKFAAIQCTMQLLSTTDWVTYTTTLKFSKKKKWYDHGISWYDQNMQ